MVSLKGQPRLMICVLQKLYVFLAPLLILAGLLLAGNDVKYSVVPARGAACEVDYKSINQSINQSISSGAYLLGAATIIFSVAPSTCRHNQTNKF